MKSQFVQLFVYVNCETLAQLYWHFYYTEVP
jgi:hypothetical protein